MDYIENLRREVESVFQGGGVGGDDGGRERQQEVEDELRGRGDRERGAKSQTEEAPQCRLCMAFKINQ